VLDNYTALPRGPWQAQGEEQRGTVKQQGGGLVRRVACAIPAFTQLLQSNRNNFISFSL